MPSTATSGFQQKSFGVVARKHRIEEDLEHPQPAAHSADLAGRGTLRIHASHRKLRHAEAQPWNTHCHVGVHFIALEYIAKELQTRVQRDSPVECAKTIGSIGIAKARRQADQWSMQQSRGDLAVPWRIEFSATLGK